MKAVVFHGSGDVRVSELPEPEPGAGEVLLAVEGCGVCGTDVHIYRGEAPARTGVVLGHEFGGRILAVGEGVSREALGRRVAVNPNLNCGYCPSCREGNIHLCLNLRALGVDLPGGFAEKAVVPALQVELFPEDLPSETITLVEPLACALHGLDLAGVRPGDDVLVQGAGPMGLILVQLARLAGAAKVAVADPSPARRARALACGADEALRPEELAPGYGVVIEATGNRSALEQALVLTKGGGTVLLFGVHPREDVASFSPQAFYRREIRLVGSFTNPHTTARAVALLSSRRLIMDSVMGATISLDDVPACLAGLRYDTGTGKTVVLAR